MIRFLERLLSYLRKRETLKTLGALRSPRWSKVRNDFIKLHPSCAICRTTEELNVHHIQPFHKFPHLELEPSNLITLCEKPGREHHLVFGHLGSYQSWNPDIVVDAKIW